MPGVSPKGPCYRFGPFELDLGEGALSRNGTRLKLQDLPYRLLVMLVERPGEIVTREEGRQRLWPENTFVEFDNSLGAAIRKVRERMTDGAEAPRYVEPVPRRGYRFVAPITVLGSETVNPAKPVDDPSTKTPMVTAADPATPTSAGNRSRYWITGITVALV